MRMVQHPERWRETHKCHEDDKLLRKFQIDVIEFLQMASIDLT